MWLRASTLLVALAVFTSSCSRNDQYSEIYVLIEPAQTVRLTNAIKTLAHEQGLDAWETQATDDRDRTMHVVEAKGHFVKLWAQNMPINTLEDSRCAALGDAEVDPGQFVVSVEASVPLLGTARARSSMSSIKSRLKALGFRVLDHPSSCSVIGLKKG